jgi:hypothetical protein
VIASGRQLFGSSTWWTFFTDGYQALDVLDDDRNGTLSGGELAGLSAWFDRNGNGRSDEGEVLPIAQLGITAISARATTTVDGCLANLAGITLNNDRVVATFDWIATAAATDR